MKHQVGLKQAVKIQQSLNMNTIGPKVAQGELCVNQINKILETVFYGAAKNVPDQLLVCRIGDL